MNRSTLFWFVFILVVLALVVTNVFWPSYWQWSMIVAFLVMLGLLGWKVFGGPIKAD